MKSKRFHRLLSTILTVCMLFAGPMGVSQARAGAPVESVAIGAGAGAAAALGTSALVGALGLGTAAVGLPVVALAGATLGGIVTAIQGEETGSRFGSAQGLSALLAGAGASVASLSGFLFSPFVLVPAAAVGIGALAYAYMKRSKQWGTPGDTRNNAGFTDPFFSPQTRLANRNDQSAYGDDRSLLDRARSVFDRDRRNDGFMAGAQVNQDGTLYRRSDLVARGMNWLNGTTLTGSYGDSYQSFGPGYGNSGYFSPGSQPRTDRLGQISVGGSSRTGFSSSMASQNAYSPTSSGEAMTAIADRDAAYKALLEAMSQQSTDPEAYQQALESYREAAEALAALR